LFRPPNPAAKGRSTSRIWFASPFARLRGRVPAPSAISRSCLKMSGNSLRRPSPVAPVEANEDGEEICILHHLPALVALGSGAENFVNQDGHRNSSANTFVGENTDEFMADGRTVVCESCHCADLLRAEAAKPLPQWIISKIPGFLGRGWTACILGRLGNFEGKSWYNLLEKAFSPLPSNGGGFFSRHRKTIN